ncbi:MAG: zinc-ribbon domain-containing protein [Oscillospiraceae bacterium]|nr:zinc-ribbon domain-containing protein [Oscillospiraceae bacterium]
MKRVFCLLLALVMIVSLGSQAFADDVLFCRMCGKQIPVDSKVCPYCGEKVVLIGEASETPDMAESKTVPLELKPTPAAVAAAPAASDASASPAAAAPTTVPAPSQAETPVYQAASAETYAAPAPTVATDTKPYSSSAASPVTSAAAAGPFNSAAPLTSTAGKVRITKNPTSESVPYGGSCTFIAHAANASSVTWYMASSDNSLVTTAAEATSVVSGLYVSGAYSDTLSLSGIPSWMNGCKVQACFSGEGGPVYSEPAWIWTYQPAQQQSNSRWTWWDWFCYYCCDDPCYWDHPRYWYDYWHDHPHCAPIWFDPGLPYDPGWPHIPDGRGGHGGHGGSIDPVPRNHPEIPEPSVEEVIKKNSGSGDFKGKRGGDSDIDKDFSKPDIPDSLAILEGLTYPESSEQQDQEYGDSSSVPESSLDQASEFSGTGFPEPSLDQVPGFSGTGSPESSFDQVPGFSGTGSPEPSLDQVPGFSGTGSPESSLDQVPGFSGTGFPEPSLDQVPGFSGAGFPEVTSVYNSPAESNLMSAADSPSAPEPPAGQFGGAVLDLLPLL